MAEARSSYSSPHVLVFPIPAQGHVNSMLKLAELLVLEGIHVTFLNSDYNHDRLVRYTDLESRFSHYSNLQFKTISDGLPSDNPRSGERFTELMVSILSTETKLLFKDILDSCLLGSEEWPPLSCIIADAVFGFSIDVARELHIPVIYFRTISACAFWAYFHILEMIEAGELPIKGDGDMDRQIKRVPGMETYLRCRDLPSFCRASDINEWTLQALMQETKRTTQVDALILNTFDDLEGPILLHICKHLPKVHTIGPLHTHLETRLVDKAITSPQRSQIFNSLREVDRCCMSWLDTQPLKSVIYVSFGSITTLKREELLEFWYGLVNSKQRFLWVMRPDSIAGKDRDAKVPTELTKATEERGCTVGWAPQVEVLAHPAIGGFLTHGGWNSILESVVAGIPMICWPYFADQQLNSRFVGEVWKVGHDMKDTCDRKIIEHMVRDVMVERKDELMRVTSKMAHLAKESVNEGGSSYCHLNSLTEDIKSMSKRGNHL